MADGAAAAAGVPKQLTVAATSAANEPSGQTVYTHALSGVRILTQVRTRRGRREAEAVSEV